MTKHNDFLRTLRKATLILSAFSLSVGCNSSPTTPTQQEQGIVSDTIIAIQAADLLQPAASAQGRVSAFSGPSAQAFSYADVKSIRIDVREKDSAGNVLYVNFDLALSGNAWKGTLPFLPKGIPLFFSAKAYSAPGPNNAPPTLLFKGDVTQSLTTDFTPIVFTLAPDNNNQTIKLPRIQRISVPTALGSDQSGNITFAVEGNTGEVIQYDITPATNGGTFYPVAGSIELTNTAGSFVSQYVSPNVTTETTFVHTVKVTNAAGHSISTTFKTKVKPTGSTNGVKDTTLSVLFNPVINSISAQREIDTNTGTLSNKVSFSATVADDGDTSTLVYAWKFDPTTGTSFNPVPGFGNVNGIGTTNPATLENYTALVHGAVELKVTDANNGTTTLNYKLAPDQFPDNPYVEGNTTGINTLRAGDAHTCALLSTGDVRCWGTATSGQLGYGNNLSVGATSTGLYPYPYSAGNVPLMGKTTKLAVGQNHTCALLDTGFVRCWGKNDVGQLGLNSKQNVGDAEPVTNFGYVNLGGIVTAISAGYNHTCALLDTGNVRCWGHNGYGQLGYSLPATQNVGDDEPAYWFKDVDLGDGVQVKDIVAGGNHTCAITTTNKVRCWGYNLHGQLGLGTTTNVGDDEKPSAVAEVNLNGGTPLQLSLGGNHTCALLDNGFLRCWGYGAHGQLGYGTTATRTTPGSDLAPGGKVLQVTTGESHTCALLSTGNVKCWGYNGYAQLGYGNTTSMNAWGADLDLSGATAYRVSAGLHHTCALLSTGAARCWGRNHGGQLGYSSTTPYLTAPAVGDVKVLSPTGTIAAGEAP
ncbi:RTX toxin [Archangium sp.]|uniref:RCC1 domain-containing protein n=1 Tax=Archangium sp. TaxID=1872627 RepID=UPI00286CB589|nr:RTX toxin [Archangium sp.]